MHRSATAAFPARFAQGASNGWLARRWYYTPRTHRPCSVRQIAPGDRRLLADQVGRTLLATLLRHAKRVGVRRLVGEMVWSNRPMQMLAMSMGFSVEPLPRDRNLRRLVLALK